MRATSGTANLEQSGSPDPEMLLPALPPVELPLLVLPPVELPLLSEPDAPNEPDDPSDPDDPPPVPGSTRPSQAAIERVPRASEEANSVDRTVVRIGRPKLHGACRTS
jgi:hypothetical protein